MSGEARLHLHGCEQIGRTDEEQERGQPPPASQFNKYHLPCQQCWREALDLGYNGHANEEVATDTDALVL